MTSLGSGNELSAFLSLLSDLIQKAEPVSPLAIQSLNVPQQSAPHAPDQSPAPKLKTNTKGDSEGGKKGKPTAPEPQANLTVVVKLPIELTVSSTSGDGAMSKQIDVTQVDGRDRSGEAIVGVVTQVSTLSTADVAFGLHVTPNASKSIITDAPLPKAETPRSDELSAKVASNPEKEAKSENVKNSGDTAALLSEFNPASTRRNEVTAVPRVPPNSPANNSGNGEPGPNDSKPQTTLKRESPEPTRGERQPQGSAAAPQPIQQEDAHSPNGAVARAVSEMGPPTKVALDPVINVASSAQPTRQISLRMGSGDSPQVDVQMTARGGTVQVSVRTQDQELAKSLQGDLSVLLGRLEDKGYKAEAWVPATDHHSPATLQQTGSAGNQDQANHSGGGTGEAGEQQERRGQNGSNQRQHARWMAQIEGTLSTDEKRTENQ